jgi:nitrite reductase (NO-forming)
MRKGIDMISSSKPSWKMKSMGLVRIAFGVVWAFAAWYKWQPSFLSSPAHYLSRHLQGQLPPAAAWIQVWINVVNINPHAFGYVVAISETAIAVALILGLFNNITYIAGGILSFLIWSTAEGFGGPYHAGATDIGTSIMYTLVFAALFLAPASRYYSVDSFLAKNLGPLRFLASAPEHTSVPAPVRTSVAKQEDARSNKEAKARSYVDVK